MNTAAQYITEVYGTRNFARAVEINDAQSLMDMMDDFLKSGLMSYEKFGCTPEYWKESGEIFAKEQIQAFLKNE